MTGSAADEQEVRKVLVAKTPLGAPWIEPEDLAPVVVFLASDAARMVSGATYDVTGGDSAISSQPSRSSILPLRPRWKSALCQFTTSM